MRKKLVLFAVLAAIPARAYKREEHYATLRLILASASVPPGDAAVIATCAQLPDEAAELSAIDIYRRLMRHPFDYAAWAALKKGPVSTAGRMLTMQQLLHGITGGSSDRMQETARALVADLSPALKAAPGPGRSEGLCALGFAYHLYADSFAHEMLKNPDKMYETGLGHFFDSAKPDFPLFSPARAGTWREFVLTTAELAGAREGELKPVIDEADELGRGAKAGNGYRQRELVRLLDGRLKERAAAPHAAFDPSLRAAGCKAVLARQFASDGLGPAPDCDRVWSLYRDAAIRRFDAAEAETGKPALRGSPFRRLKYFTDSPFSKGAAW